LILAGAGLGVVALIVLIVVLVSSGGQKSPGPSGVKSSVTPPVTQPPANGSPSQSAQVVDSGFTQTKEAPDNSSSTTVPPKAAVTWAVVVRNQSSSLIARSVSFDLTFLDAAGKTVATDSGTIETILPGQTAASAYYTDAAGVARMSVSTPTVDQWQTPTQALGSLSATNVFLVPETDGTNTTDVTIASTFTRSLDLEAVAVWYDASNKIIGGDYDPSETVMANGRKNVEVTTSVVTPKVDHVKAFVFIDDSDVAL
jgi:hypothetical protein